VQSNDEIGRLYTRLKRLRVTLTNKRKEEADERTRTADLLQQQVFRVYCEELKDNRSLWWQGRGNSWFIR
jgi:hypothetical protein